MRAVRATVEDGRVVLDEPLRCDPDSWTVRVTRDYRAVGRKHEDTMIWYWIGSHAEFDKHFPA